MYLSFNPFSECSQHKKKFFEFFSLKFKRAKRVSYFQAFLQTLFLIFSTLVFLYLKRFLC